MAAIILQCEDHVGGGREEGGREVGHGQLVAPGVVGPAGLHHVTSVFSNIYFLDPTSIIHGWKALVLIIPCTNKSPEFW